MESSVQKFCQIVRKRSEENKKSFSVLYANRLFGQAVSVLRQELDSMVRCIYLLTLQDLSARDILVNQTLDGERWRYPGRRIITDKDMVEISSKLHGWTQSVYDFGCAFVHLTNFHGYTENDPFHTLDDLEEHIIKDHLNNYHGYNLDQKLTFESIIPYLSKVFEKVVGNSKYYVDRLEKNEVVDASTI